MKTSILGGAAAVGIVAAMGLASPAAAISATTADLYVLHAVPDTPVDVYVDGTLTLDDFQPGDLAGPLDLPAGDYEVAITAPDAPDDSAPVIGPITLTLAAGTSYTAVAHLDESGGNTATLFTNDISATAAGEGRLTVRHTAAAPAVDILAGGSPVVNGLTNPNEATLNLPVGVVSAAVALAGTTEPVIGPADVAIEDGVLTIVYAWGSAEAGNLDLAVQTISGLHTPPSGVPSGEAGLVATNAAPLAAALTLAGCSASTEQPAATRAASPTPSAPSGIAVQGTELSVPEAVVPPVRVQVPAAGIDVSVEPVGLAADGQMELPPDPAVAGWYRFGPGPDSDAGTAVIAAHVDSLVYGLGPFSALLSTAPGAEVMVTTADGQVYRYALASVESVPKDRLPLGEVFDRSGAPRIALITCGGAFDGDTGHYLDNIVATATPVA